MMQDLPEFAEVAQTLEFRLLVLAFLILAGPYLAQRARLPGLVGLIFLGMLFGPFVFGWLEPLGLIAVVGMIGLLYLMFLAGLELDINTFIANRRASITFGLLTFAIPFGVSFLVAFSYLEFAGTAAALIGAMWASHTLVAYTEVKNAGLESNRAIGAAVSATIITDILALLVLGFAASSEAGVDPSAGHEDLALVPVYIGIFVLGGFCLWVLPRMSEWFFVRVGRSRNQRFVWTLGGMAAGGVVALLGGIEGLVGAFLAGIGMNRLIPANGVLMERIEFFGGALFVPAFLVSVGMSIDPGALAQASTIRLALVFAGMVLVGKTLAAVVSGRMFRFSWPEIGMMASLTIGQAAATLAIAQVGFNNGIFDQEVINAAVLAVVITVVITSIGTRFFSRLMEPPTAEAGAIGKHVLLRVPDRGDIAGLLDIGVALSRSDDGLLEPFIVCDETGCGELTTRLDEAVQGAIDRGQDSEGITRVSPSLARGVLNLATETGASSMILPWDGPGLPVSGFFGNGIDEIGEGARTHLIAARVLGDDWNRVLLFTGRSKGLSVRDEDARLAMRVATDIASHLSLEQVVFTTRPDEIEKPNQYAAVHQYSGRSVEPLSQIAAGDVVVVPAHVAEDAIGFGVLRLSRYFEKASLLIVSGPGRLRVSPGRVGDRVLTGSGFNRRAREHLSETWEGYVR